MSLEGILLEVSEALRYPVVALALAALAVTLVEAGAFSVELRRRRRRDFASLARASADARAALEQGHPEAAARRLTAVAPDPLAARALAALVGQWAQPAAEDGMAKTLADFDLRSLRRLERTRVLVRAGPGLGLMGTLIPLSPALSALGRGDIAVLSDSLRVAFGITVIGMLVGMVAFWLSLVRDRLYAQDHSDLEYVAAVLGRTEAA